MASIYLSVECIARQLCLMIGRAVTVETQLDAFTPTVLMRASVGDLFSTFRVHERDLTLSLEAFQARYLDDAAKALSEALLAAPDTPST